LSWDHHPRVPRALEGSNQPRLVRDDDELGAVPGAQLGQDAAHVCLGRGDAHVEVSGEFRIRTAPRHRHEHLWLPFGEDSELVAGVRGCTARALGIGGWLMVRRDA
jgi:hypothetical protein